MATFNKFNSFVEAVMEKKHDLGSDTLKIALCAAANAPVATNSVLADLVPIAYTNVVTDGAGSRAFTRTSSSQTGGTYSLVLADMTITATGGAIEAFQYIVIYNDTATNDELIGWADYGSDLVLSETGTLLIDVNASGLFTFT